MHFHLPSFLLDILVGIVLIVFTIYLMLRWSVQVDAKLAANQKRLDDYPSEDSSLNEPTGTSRLR
jgi:hypothetical protein